jgi:hypothetical protein
MSGDAECVQNDDKTAQKDDGSRRNDAKRRQKTTEDDTGNHGFCGFSLIFSVNLKSMKTISGYLQVQI